MSQVTVCEIESHAFALSPIITPESTTQSCWLFVCRFFKYQYCVFSQRSRGVPWFINEKSIAVGVQSFMKTISNYFCVISPHEFRCIQNVFEFHRETQWNFKMSQNPLCITTCQVTKYFNGEGEGKKLIVRESIFFFKILPISGTTPWVSKPQ